MSKYLPLNLRWRFLTKEGRAQFKSLFYRIYINIFGIFLRIKLLPMSYSRGIIWFYYRGDEIGWHFKKKHWISCGFSGTGEFGDAIYSTLKSMDKEWNDYFDTCAQITEREDKEYKYRTKNNLCTDVFCSIEGEHKKHDANN